MECTLFSFLVFGVCFFMQTERQIKYIIVIIIFVYKNERSSKSLRIQSVVDNLSYNIYFLVGILSFIF